MKTPRELIRTYGIHPRRGLGQSFLIDRNIIEKIVAGAGLSREDLVLEIGAGIGVMTRLIAERVSAVTALEIDPVMVDLLQRELSELTNVTIHHQDALTYEFPPATAGEPGRGGIKVIGNIPYNISTQILFRLIQRRESVSEMVLMFQKEVADRIMASPGSRDYGILSVMTDMYTIRSRILTVPPGCFYPRPKVDSAVLKMRIREVPLRDIDDHELFLKVVKAAFSKRRKTLMNNLKDAEFLLSHHIDPRTLLDRLGIDGRRRGETLSCDEFGRLSAMIAVLQKERP